MTPKALGNSILITSLCVIGFWLLMAWWPVHAGERLQGDVPTGKLPTYPGVVCLTPDWKPEPCESRRVPEKSVWEHVADIAERLAWLDKTWLPIAEKEIVSWNGIWPPITPLPKAGVTYIYGEIGGEFWSYWNRFKALADSGNNVELHGPCMSACTLVVVHVPSERLCFGEGSSLQFHVSRDPKTGTPTPEFTQANMINQYPQDIRAWINAKGGVQKMNISQMWTLTAEELWQMGYHKCENNIEPIPMTVVHGG